MADDSNSRYRSRDPYGHQPSPVGQGNDPLSELARLIGQSDPFAAPGQDSGAPAPRDTGQRYADPPPLYPNDPPPRFLTEPSQQPYGSGGPPGYPDPSQSRYADAAPQSYESEPQPRYDTDFPPRTGNDDYARPPLPDWLPGAVAASRPFAPDPFAMPSAATAPQPHDPPQFEDMRYGGTQAHSDAATYPGEQPAHDAAGFHGTSDRPPFPPAMFPVAPDASAMPPPHEDEFYDDAPRGGRRKGMTTIVAVLALALLGTAGAFAYRSYFGTASSSAPPPIIRASAEPTKVAPPPSTSDPAANKFSYDRFGDRGQNEQVVVREETPIAAGDLARSTVPRTVLPASPLASNPPPPAVGAPSAIGEPRRVRTVPIRPDQPELVAAPQAMPLQSAPPPRQSNVAAAAPPPANAPLSVTPEPARSAPPAARPPSRVQTAARSAPNPPAANAPLSLVPGGNTLPPPAAVQAQQPPPRRAASPPTRLAAAPTGGGSRYHVQVSSQRSEADAETSFHNLQTRFSNVLGGYSHVIRRADLGNRGVYYRAMVGPFGSREEAVQVCTNLKAAGGDCVVH